MRNMHKLKGNNEGCGIVGQLQVVGNQTDFDR